MLRSFSCNDKSTDHGSHNKNTKQTRPTLVCCGSSK